MPLDPADKATITALIVKLQTQLTSLQAMVAQKQTNADAARASLAQAQQQIGHLQDLVQQLTASRNALFGP